MRTARLEYASGRDVLRDYWGSLWSGGLVLAERAASFLAGGFTDGDPVLLDVRVASLRKEYRVPGRLHRRDDGRAVVRFDEKPQELLYAVWADGQGVPERRHRRYDLDLPVRYSARHDGEGRVVNVSRGGICLRVDASTRAGAALRAGERVVVHFAEPVEAALWGRVRWVGGRGRLVGIEFETFQEEVVRRLLEGPAEPTHEAPL